MRDLHNNIATKRAISPVVATDNTAIVSQIIDRSGYDALEFVIATGTLADADATFAVTLSEGDDSGLSDAGTVAAADILGTTTLASFNYANDDSVFRIGYKGYKRYVRLTITPSANTGNAPVAAVAVLGAPKLAPTANP